MFPYIAEMALSPKSLPKDLHEEHLPFQTFIPLLGTPLSQEESLEQFSKLLGSLPVQSPQETFCQIGTGDKQQSHDDLTSRHMEQHVILSQFWRPCSGEMSIGEHLDYIQFPVSYRDLVYRWIALGRPDLSNIRRPHESHFPSSYLSNLHSDESSLNLQKICEEQEVKVIDSIKAYFEQGQVFEEKLFDNFASHVDMYSALSAELTCLESGLMYDSRMQIHLYEETWKNTLQAFELDRSICSARSSHDCFRYLLWGEVYNWPLQEIERKFKEYKTQSSLLRPILIREKAEDNLLQGLYNLISQPSCSASISRKADLSANKSGTSSPSLPITFSSLGLSSPVTNTSPAQDLSLPGNASWYNNSSDHSFETPSLYSPSTRGASPLRYGDIQGEVATKEANYQNSFELKTQNQGNFSDTVDLFKLFIGCDDLFTYSIDRRSSGSSSQSIHKVGNQDCKDDKSQPLENKNPSSSPEECKSRSSFTSNRNASSTPVTPSVGANAEYLQSQSPLTPPSYPKRPRTSIAQQGRSQSIIEPSLSMTDEFIDIYNLLDQEKSDVGLSVLNTLIERRDSSSSIGSSFASDSNLDKVEQYRTMLQDAASHLDTAARLLSVQAGQVRFRRQSRENVRRLAIIAARVNAAASQSFSNTVRSPKRARLAEKELLRPSRPRSQTTS